MTYLKSKNEDKMQNKEMKSWVGELWAKEYKWGFNGAKWDKCNKIIKRGYGQVKDDKCVMFEPKEMRKCMKTENGLIDGCFWCLSVNAAKWMKIHDLMMEWTYVQVYIYGLMVFESKELKKIY